MVKKRVGAEVLPTDEHGQIAYDRMSIKQLRREQAHLGAMTRVDSLKSSVHKDLQKTLRHVECLIDEKINGKKSN